MISKTTPEFWEYYRRLPRDIQKRADKQFQLLKQNPNHLSLMLKKRDDRIIGPQELTTTIVQSQFKAGRFSRGFGSENMANTTAGFKARNLCNP